MEKGWTFAWSPGFWVSPTLFSNLAGDRGNDGGRVAEWDSWAEASQRLVLSLVPQLKAEGQCWCCGRQTTMGVFLDKFHCPSLMESHVHTCCVVLFQQSQQTGACASRFPCPHLLLISSSGCLITSRLLRPINLTEDIKHKSCSFRENLW